MPNVRNHLESKVLDQAFQVLLHLVSQYPGWSLMPDGSIRVAEATEDSLGTYTCVPYNALGTMGMSPPATLVLKVRWCSRLVQILHVVA